MELSKSSPSFVCIILDCGTCSRMAGMPATSFATRWSHSDGGGSKSSNDPIQLMDSKYFLADGSWNGHSLGSAAVEDSPKISRRRSRALWPGLLSHTSEPSPDGSQELDSIGTVLSQTLSELHPARFPPARAPLPIIIPLGGDGIARGG